MERATVRRDIQGITTLGAILAALVVTAVIADENARLQRELNVERSRAHPCDMGTAGSGLSGGALSGQNDISLAPCDGDKLVRWNGAAWVCR